MKCPFACNKTAQGVLSKSSCGITMEVSYATKGIAITMKAPPGLLALIFYTWLFPHL